MEELSRQEKSHLHCVVPDWNQHQGRSLTQVQFHPGLNTTRTAPSRFPPHLNVAAEVPGAMHGADMDGVRGVLPLMPSLKSRWGGSSDTLESIVRQATRRDVGPPKSTDDRRTRPQSCAENLRKVTRVPGLTTPSSQAVPRKRSCASEPVLGRKNACLSSGTCGSGSSMFNTREDDANTMMTTKLTEEDDASQDESGSKDEEDYGRGGTGHASRFSKQSKGSVVTTKMRNLSERRRRDMINEKMKALQKMVPNSSKTDKASMLDEVIVYMKQLQAQVEMMKLIRSNAADDSTNVNGNVNVPQMMNAMMTGPPATLPPQELLQMSLLARMGVGLGLGMLNHANGSTTNNTFISPTVSQPQLPTHFLMPQMIPAARFTAGHLNPSISRPLASMPLQDPYMDFLARKISMENYYTELAALQQQQTGHHPSRSDKTRRP